MFSTSSLVIEVFSGKPITAFFIESKATLKPGAILLVSNDEQETIKKIKDCKN